VTREEELIVEGEFEEEGGGAWRVVSGLALALLVISYSVLNPSVREVVVSLFESEQGRGVFEHDGKTVVFENNTWPLLVSLFKSSQRSEFKACLLGSLSGAEYRVGRVTIPRTYFKTVFKVVSEPCPPGTIISLHSHPYLRCVASQQDLSNLER